jgi:outer membrane protein assembly factor BamB
MVAEVTTDPLRELLDAGEPYQGPVVRWLRVDETLPLPRNLEYAGVAFPPAAMRRRRVVLPRYSGLAVLSSGELTASAGNGAIDQLRPDGTTARLAQLAGAGAVVAGGGADRLYALDYLGGRIVRVRADGAVEPFAEGLTRPAALAVVGDGVVLVAEDTGRLLRISATPPVSR